MIRSEILSRLQRLLQSATPPEVAAGKVAFGANTWTPGQLIPSIVIASLPNGNFQVNVGNLLLEMKLPGQPQAGDLFELTFISNQPRLIFSIAGSTSASAGGQSLIEAKPQVTLSDSAHVLGSLLQEIADRAKSQKPTVDNAIPLLSTPAAGIRDIAGALKNALSQSGMFYESHQAQWIAGERTILDLRQEPQGKIPTPPLRAAAETAPDLVSRLPSLDSPDSQQTSRLPVHGDAVSLVQQQIQALDSRQLIWRGLVWQDQPMEWRVEERNAREGTTANEETPHWQTSLRVKLHRLGGLEATMNLTPQGIRIDLIAENSDSAQAMERAKVTLQDAMAASGLNVLRISTIHK